MDKSKQIDMTASLFGVGDFNGPPPVNPSVEIFKAITKEIFSTKNMELKTDITPEQVLVFSTAISYSKRYKIPLLAEIIKNYSKYAVSKERKGRGEFSDISKANLQMASNDEITRQSIPDRLLGR